MGTQREAENLANEIKHRMDLIWVNEAFLFLDWEPNMEPEPNSGVGTGNYWVGTQQEAEELDD